MMGRRVGSLLLLIAVGLTVPVWASTASLSGKVKNAQGIPQMGALVEATQLGGTTIFEAFTDEKGNYVIHGLLPGSYDVRVTAVSFLPTLREDVSLHSGASLVLNLTLNTLNDAIRLLPAKQGSTPDDDWKWTLRSTANRPILRLNNGQPVVIANGSQDHPLKTSVALVAGGDGSAFGGDSPMSTQVSVERSLFQTGLLSFNGNVGYGDGPNDTVLHASYAHAMPNGSVPEVAVTMQRFATSPTQTLHDAALQALTIHADEKTQVFGFVDLAGGADFQTVQFMGHVNAYKPFGSADVHLSPNSVLQYQYTTSVPTTRGLKGYDSAPADMTEAGPRMTMVDEQTVLEKARHQEVSVSHRTGKTSVQVAYFRDHIFDTALTGVGQLNGDYGSILPDVYSGTFAYNGGKLDTNGVRLVVERRLPDGMTATVDYAFGGVLDMVEDNAHLSDARSQIDQSYRSAVTFKLAGALTRSKTQWLASYKWTNPGALTPVDLFNAGPGQSDPYLNIFIRQPIPGASFIPVKMEALLDLRNLLAQGYHPMLGPDGETVYLVQSARSVRGGVAFVF
jgi:Carboxypeptidase regulatory-like domain